MSYVDSFKQLSGVTERYLFEKKGDPTLKSVITDFLLTTQRKMAAALPKELKVQNSPKTEAEGPLMAQDSYEGLVRGLVNKGGDNVFNWNFRLIRTGEREYQQSVTLRAERSRSLRAYGKDAEQNFQDWELSCPWDQDPMDMLPALIEFLTNGK